MTAVDMPFKVHPELTGIALAYRNTDYIADEVLPRVSVSSKVFEYNKHSDDAFLSVPDAEIGRKGMPETMELKHISLESACKNYSVLGEVPQEDVEVAQGSTAAEKEDPIGDNTLLVTDGLKLAREKRVADLLSNTATYDGNVLTLSGTDRFSNKQSSFTDTYFDIKNNKMLVEPNTMVVSSIGASYLQTHPDFVAMYKGENSNNRGLVPLDFIAQQLGLNKIIVGKAKANSVKPGKTAVIQSVWGLDMILLYLNPLAKPKMGLTFGMTAEFGELEVQTYFNGLLGSKGINYIKPVESVKEIVLAPSCGFLVKNAFTTN